MKPRSTTLVIPALLLLAAASGAQVQTPSQQRAMLVDYYTQAYGPASEAAAGFSPDVMQLRLLAKARPDEFFSGIGSMPTPPECTGMSIPKVNQAYVWGLARADRKLWFGTAPNVHCLVIGGYLGLTEPIQTPSYVCEFGESFYAKTYGLPAAIGDMRPPHIYVYDMAAVAPDSRLRDLTANVDAPTRLLLAQTLGIRSAGTNEGVVFLAGPALVPPASINVFAFDAQTTRFLGYANLGEYDNVRKWVVADGELYVGVGNSFRHPEPGGSVLRWTGSKADPFQFETVGLMGSQVAELTEHQGRLFVTTWPAGGELASVYYSPLMPPGGLTSVHELGWTKIWQADDYDPDPVCAATYGGGAIASYGDWVYWGTMHVPGLSFRAFLSVFGVPADPISMAVAALGTYRAISIHRARFTDEECAVEMECLYGMRMLPAYSPVDGWRLEANRMNEPRFGLAGFGNLFNNYTWTMEVNQGRLFVGTMDWSYLLLGDLLTDVALPSEFAGIGCRQFGADLWAFNGTAGPARPVLLDGLTNETNYGIRTMASDDRTLYLGTANPMNLHEKGGWELRALRLATDRIDPTGL